MQGNLDLAIDELKVNLTIDRDHAPSLNALGYFYAERNVNLEEAERLVRRALLQEPDNGAFLDSLGWVYFKQGRLRDAVEKLTEAAEKEPDPVIFEHVGDALKEMGQTEQARQWWRKALELDPEVEGPRLKLRSASEEDLDQ
jgi:tetratricopeptide (TPR) repeat protein